MIRVEKVQIREFRGIRDLTLSFNASNFAACGPNGTGKSGIVDAIEFGLTGSISRLAGSGTGGLSVKQHGPHVDSRNKPDEAFVAVDVSIASLGKKATILRTVKDASAPKITPDDPDVRAALEQVAQHPEFVLSRRELIRYVLSEPGNRSKEVQALLRLDDVEKLRTVLQRISNAAGRDVPGLKRAQDDAASKLLSALGITQLTSSSVLAAVNPRRVILGLPELSSLEAGTSLKDGLATTTTGGTSSRVPKAQAQADLAKAREAIAGLLAEEFEKQLAHARALLGDLLKDPKALEEVSKESLLRSALEHFDGEHCPVCDASWSPQTFQDHLSDKLTSYAATAAKRAELEKVLEPLIAGVEAARSCIVAVAACGPRLNPAVDVDALKALGSKLQEVADRLTKVLPLTGCDAALVEVGALPDAEAALGAVETGIAAIPEPSKQDAARDFLTVGQERLEAFRDAAMKLKIAKDHAATAQKVFEVYGAQTTKSLEAIYKQVEAKFIELYRIINHEDEASFTAQLKPSIGKLGFDVDFYGRGHFPPGAYHSEGHQDGMGLCLYLALMHHLLGPAFTLAVLDDVLMSVDAGHRREVCNLLKSEFPDTQFVFTTHDEIWLRHMKSAGLIQGKGFAHFRTWTVDVGPTEWDDRNVWDEIDGELKKNNVKGAAGLLRHYLEHFAGEACDRLRAQVEYRGDAQFTLGELLPNAVSALGSRLKKAKAAANSWNQKEVLEVITDREQQFSAAKAASKVDEWQLNTAIHFNAWDNLQRADFEPVTVAFRALTDAFMCESCEGQLYVSPERGPNMDALRCGCGGVNINLLAK